MHSSVLSFAKRSCALALAMVLTSACAAGTDELTLRINTHTFQVAVAATAQQRERGLMGRTRLPENGGMLFIFDYAGRHCFWMRNTPLPLSIAFIDEVGRIANITDMQPQTDTLHCPTTAVRYALEIAQGGFQQRGITPGSMVEGLRP